ncbi:hypothetical protein KEM52_001484 [Ascosphaera acerosa]|nr:hypothetical protein KEM52_001484 [Ascosphaera acerosa]
MSRLGAAGRKRPASEALDGEQQRLSKRFNQLHIGSQLVRVGPAARCTSPDISSSGSGSPSSSDDDEAGGSSSMTDEGEPCLPDTTDDGDGDGGDEFMDVEDTKHRVFIGNLEREIREIERLEKQGKEPIILPGLEKLIYRPGALRLKPPAVPSNELVLYKVPASISVPEQHDSVRRALADHRDRASERLVAHGLTTSQTLFASDEPEQAQAAIAASRARADADADADADANDDDAMDVDEEL